MPWFATIYIAVRKNKDLTDILEKNGFPREDASVFDEILEDTELNKLNVDDLLNEYDIFEGIHIMALTRGDLGSAEDFEENLFTEFLFDNFYGIQTYREKIFDGDIIIFYLYDS